MDFAEHQFKLNKTDQNGTTEREHLEQVERQTGKEIPQLRGPEFPKLVSHIWSAFTALHSRRQMGFNGPMGISYSDIKHWKELTDTPLDAWEVEAIIAVDNAYMRVAYG